MKDRAEFDSAPNIEILDKDVRSKASGFIARAGQLAGSWEVTRRLGLEDEKDQKLALTLLTQRLIRTSVYDTSSVLKSAQAVMQSRFKSGSSQIRAIDTLDRNKRAILDLFDIQITDFIDKNYQDPNSRMHARTIELAINALIAQATPQSPRSNLADSLRMPGDTLDVWAARWRPQLAQAAAQPSAQSDII